MKQCFPCTACCQGWLHADINGVKMKPGTPCIHALKQGCGIYETRPEVPCVSFKCGWLQDQHKLPAHMKPSECGAIVMFDRKWHDRDVIRAIPTGLKVPAETLDWLMAYSRKTLLPLLFSERLLENNKFARTKDIGYGPPDFIHAVKTELGSEDIMMF